MYTIMKYIYLEMAPLYRNKLQSIEKALQLGEKGTLGGALVKTKTLIRS